MEVLKREVVALFRFYDLHVIVYSKVLSRLRPVCLVWSFPRFYL